jgi:hypothetical protein
MRMKLHKLLILSMLLVAGVSFGGEVYMVAKYGLTGGIVAPLSTTADKVNGRDICPANPTAGCDFANNPGYDGGALENQTDDTYSGDLIVRTNDNFQAIAGWRWHGTADGADEKIVIIGTLPDSGYYEYTVLPGSCDPAESSISADKQMITCVRKDFDKNDAGTYSEDLTFDVHVLGGVPHGAQPGDITFRIEDATGGNASVDDTDNHSLTVTAAPRWNLEKNLYSVRSGREYDADGDGAVEKGWLLDYMFIIETDAVRSEADTANPSIGNESLGKDATIEFADDTSGMPAGSVVTRCSMEGRLDHNDGYNGSRNPLSCIGSGCIYGNSYPERHILVTKDNLPDVTCLQTGDQVAIKLEHVDATLDHYPTKDYYGRDLASGRAVATFVHMGVFVPLEAVQKGHDGVLGTADDGRFSTHNTVTDFDPATPTSNSNFGDETESENDNNKQYTLYYSYGYWNKYF